MLRNFTWTRTPRFYTILQVLDLIGRTDLKRFLLLTLPLFMLSGCALYRMPEEGEVNTVPTTNNPAVTRQSFDNWMPGVEY